MSTMYHWQFASKVKGTLNSVIHINARCAFTLFVASKFRVLRVGRQRFKNAVAKC